MTAPDNARLLELADACEKASGPDRKLDERIADILFTEKQWHCVKGLSDEDGGAWFWRNPDGSIGTALRFTASLDAAMTLVPEGWLRSTSNEIGYEEASLNNHVIQRTAWGCADSAALALTAAALRALAAQGGDA